MPGLADLLAGPVLDVAPQVLGAVLRHETTEGAVVVRLSEVEAYGGEADPGSHAFRGSTGRTQVMFGPAGRLYVYLSYGMHFCCNVVCGPEGQASAVLLRAGQVIEGLELARVRRGSGPDRDLARGPARLCGALGIDLTHNGTDLRSGSLTLSLKQPAASDAVSTGPRVGLRRAADRPWRFWLTSEPTVSVYRPAKKLR